MITAELTRQDKTADNPRMRSLLISVSDLPKLDIT